MDASDGGKAVCGYMLDVAFMFKTRFLASRMAPPDDDLLASLAQIC